MSKLSHNLFRSFSLLAVAALLLLGCQEQRERSGEAQNGANAAEPILLLAAASTQDALNEIMELYRAEHAGKVLSNYASSGTLAQQILRGAPADLFLSANLDWMDRLEAEQLVSRRKNVLGNELVLIAPADSKLQPQRLEQLRELPIEYLALADPESVPAGIYGKQILEKTGLWEPLKARIVRGADVRQALLFVERGEADCGIVYATDAAASKKVRVLLPLDAQLYEPIVYPLAIIKQSPAIKPSSPRPEVERLYRFLTSPTATEVFKQHGFQPLDASLPTSNPQRPNKTTE